MKLLCKHEKNYIRERDGKRFADTTKIIRVGDATCPDYAKEDFSYGSPRNANLHKDQYLIEPSVIPAGHNWKLAWS